MKKILIIALTLFALASCGVKEEVKNIVVEKKVETTKNISNKSNKDEKEISNKIDISTLEENLSKLKNIEVDEMELDMINSQIENLYNSNIIKKAIKNNNLEICNKLDSNEIESCKNTVIVKKGDIKNCEKLSNTGSINNCKNSINRTIANQKLDETICEKIIDNSEEKTEVTSCKDRIFEKKATKELDAKICKSISDKDHIEMCEDLVRIEKEISNK